MSLLGESPCAGTDISRCREISERVQFTRVNARGVDLLSVDAAARVLGVHPGRVRQLVAAGQLDAHKVGGRWLLPEAAVMERHDAQRPAGRPLSPRAAWGLLAGAAGQRASWLSPSEERRARARAAGWPLERWAWACQRRAVVHRLYAHSSVLGRLADDDRVVRSGASARSVPVDVIASGVVEGYVDASQFGSLVGDYALHEGDRANVVLRVPPPELFVFGDERDAPWPVVAVDLLDAGDDRSRRAAVALVARFRP